MTHPQITFIGAGNMARSLISGLLHAGFPATHIHATDVDLAKAQQLTHQLGIHSGNDNIAAVKQADVVVLAVKPQYMADMLTALSAGISDYDQTLFISIAAGVTVSRLQSLLHGHDHIVRCMPNTPSLIGAGITGLYASPAVTETEKNQAATMLQSVGRVLWVDSEADINNVTAASGSGPAYFFLFMECMAAEAEKMGFSPENARLLVQETALGAAKMVIVNPTTPLATLREQVTSKGGTTAAALNTFHDAHLSELVAAAMQAAKKRAEEMETLF